MRKYSSFWRTSFILWVYRKVGNFSSWLWYKSWSRATPPLDNKGWGKSTIDME